MGSYIVWVVNHRLHGQAIGWVVNHSGQAMSACPGVVHRGKTHHHGLVCYKQEV